MDSSARDNNGSWSGFDVDLCRAVAAAIFNDASKVSYVPLDASRRFEALPVRQRLTYCPALPPGQCRA